MKYSKRPIVEDGKSPYLDRSDNEFELAKALLQLSQDAALKKTLNLKIDRTFYSNAISAAYYVVFYTAKAYLLSKGVETAAPREHEKTYERFSWFVETGVLDKELLFIYTDAKMKAESLLNIFKEEKDKRGKFTYRKLPRANRKPAEESVKNARKFFAAISELLRVS